MNSCAKSKSREYIEVMVTVTPSMTPTFLTFWFSGQSIDSPTIGASEDFEASKGPRNRPKPVWMNQETTARGPIEHDFLDESAELWHVVIQAKRAFRRAIQPAVYHFFQGAKFWCIKNEGTMLAAGCFLHPKKRDALGFSFRNWKNGSWTFRPCTPGGFLTNLPLGCSPTSVGHQ